MDKSPYFIRDTAFTSYHIKANLSICFRTFVRAIQLSEDTHQLRFCKDQLHSHFHLFQPV